MNNFKCKIYIEKRNLNPYELIAHLQQLATLGQSCVLCNSHPFKIILKQILMDL